MSGESQFSAVGWQAGKAEEGRRQSYASLPKDYGTQFNRNQ